MEIEICLDMAYFIGLFHAIHIVVNNKEELHRTITRICASTMI
jgi:hypothetical protein